MISWIVVFSIPVILFSFGYVIKRHKEKNMSQEEIQVRQWEDLKNHIARKYKMNQQYDLPDVYNPMAHALNQRRVIQQLLSCGHGRAAVNVMKEFDDTIETIKALTLALDECSLGEWKYDKYDASKRTHFYNFIKNDEAIAVSLRKEMSKMLNQQLTLIKHVQMISSEGVSSSIESAKLQLQIHKQDYVEVKDSMAQAAKEIEHNPL